MGPLVAYRALLLLLLVAAVAWLVRSSRWRERRLWFLAAALLAGLALLSRRVGWAELLLIAGLIVVPAVLFAPRRR